jgi:D-serine deaminase-like pyridoxal phosphate-dependent protein
MAQYFAAHGWQDICVAFPANVLESRRIDALAAGLRLHVLIDSAETATALDAALHHTVHGWIKVDVGKGRAGISWEQPQEILNLARTLRGASHLSFAGLLTHAGHSYDASGAEAVLEVHRSTHARMEPLRQMLEQEGLGPCAVSVGDTPCCTLAPSFPGADEIRPGNFVFYDLQQAALGVCGTADIAVSVACPVVEKSASRRQLVLYGGAVHLSKDRVRDAQGRQVYGVLATWMGDTWGEAHAEAALVSVSQEHGLIDIDAASFAALDVGDLVVVLPAHSCLTSDLHAEYRCLDGSRVPRRRSNDLL